MNLKPANPATMWAAVTTHPWGRNEHISRGTISRTRREARAAYLALFEPSYHRKALKHARFARVVVTLEVSP